MENQKAADASAPQGSPEVQANYFQVLSAVDVTPFLFKKGEFNYLPWADAVRELLVRYPESTFEVVHYNGLPFLPCPIGYMVEVAVTVCGITRKSLLPVMDDNHISILQPTSFDINTSLQRCTVKAIALHGLGLSVYSANPDLALPNLGAVGLPGNVGTVGAGTQANASGSAPQTPGAANPAEAQLEAEDEATLQTAFSKLKLTEDPARLKTALKLVTFKSRTATLRFHTALAERALSLGAVLADIFGELPIPKVDPANVKPITPKAQPAAGTATKAPVAQAAPAQAPAQAPVQAPVAAAPVKTAPAASPSSDSSSFF